MNLLIILLLIPFSFAGSPPACGELGKIITQYEVDLQKSTVKNCKSIQASQLKRSSDLIEVGDLQNKVCNDLMTIEAELENLKIQQTVLSGIDKLKKVVETSQSQTKSKDARVQRVAGMKFATSLDVAQSVELLVHSYDSEGVPLISRLKKISEETAPILNKDDLKARVKEVCKGINQKQNDACNSSLFNPSDEAFTEIKSLMANSKADANNIKMWQKSLAIKKKAKPAKGEVPEGYSFTQMKQELGSAFEQIDKNAPLSKDQIIAIQKLDEFENADGFSFVEDIASLKDTVKSKVAFDTFSLHTGNASLRQKMDTQSRVSVLWETLQSEGKELLGKDAEACARAKNSHSDAAQCIKALNNPGLKFKSADTQSNLARLLPALNNSLTFSENLDSKVFFCEAEFKKENKLSESCANLVSKSASDIANEIHNLNILKERIGFENQENMLLRNFALQKWQSQKCDSKTSTLDFCESNDLISREVVSTSGDMISIAALFEPKSPLDESVKKLCDEDDVAENRIRDRLCEFFNDTTDDITPAQVFVDSDTSAPDGGHEKAMRRDAIIQGGSHVLQEALNYMMNSQYTNQYNPYQYNYSPYNFGTGGMGIADTILFDSRYYGAYGFYMPTPGYTPYKAFGPSFVSPTSSNFTPYTSAYSASSTDTASFFNFK